MDSARRPRVLVVDDSSFARTWTTRVLAEAGLDVLAVADGPSAIEALHAEEFDAIVLDDEMPGMTGREVLATIRREGMPTGVVMLTGSEDLTVEGEAMRMGADRFMRKPCPGTELVGAVGDACETAARRRQRHARELHLDGEVQAAAAIQAALLPEHPPLPDGWRLSTAFLPAREVGGDTYDLVPGGGRTLFLVVADVSGKGVGAALFAAMAQTALRAAFARGDGPAAALSSANALLFDSLARAGRFLTAFVAEVDPVTGRVAYADAGHGHHLVLGGDGRDRELPGGSSPLGFLPHLEVPLGTETLAPGETLAVFSDGLVEGTDDLDTERVRGELVAGLRDGASPSTLVAQAPDADDRTLVVLSRR